MPPSPRRIRTPEGLELNCVDWEGSGEPILLLHGGTLTCHTWDLVCLAMRGRFRCVAVDLRGHGNSDWADSYTMDAYVNDVAAVIADFRWAMVHMVGMSLGGIIAAHYAATVGSRAASSAMVDVAPNVDFGAVGPMRDFMEPSDRRSDPRSTGGSCGRRRRPGRTRQNSLSLSAHDPDWPRRQAGMASRSNEAQRLWSSARQA